MVERTIGESTRQEWKIWFYRCSRYDSNAGKSVGTHHHH